MKKITSILVVLTLLATLFTAVPVSAASDNWGGEAVATAFAGGTGTTSDPYLISNAAELRYMNDLVNSGATYVDSSNATKNYYAAAYKLTADIDMQNTDWIPLGWYRPTSYNTSNSSAVYTPAFTGRFDGNKHVIKNINMNWDQTHPISGYMGFFGYCNSATITNLGLDNVKIVFSNYDYKYDETNNKTVRVANSGVLAGQLRSTTVTECYVINSVVKNTNSGKNDTSVAGFVGSLNYGNKISNCYVYNVEICAGQLAAQAGFFGILYSDGNVLTNCYAAKITCNQPVNFATTYGFGYSNGVRVSAVECYSTMQDAQGDHISAYDVARAYNPAHSVGETGVPAETLIKKMTDTLAYAQNPSINDGYPYLVTKSPAIVPATAYAGGDGSTDSPYLISTPEQLFFMANNINAGTDNTKSFKLTADINVAGQEWTPIGTSTNRFRGVFDGDGHKIMGVTISGTPALQYMGFFGYVGNGQGTVVKNLGLENLNIAFKHSTGNYIGGFAGAIGQHAVIENCYVKDSAVKYDTNYGSSGTFYIASFAGIVTANNDNATSYDNSPVIRNCYTYNVEIKAAYDRTLAGFIGAARSPYAAQIENCYVAGVRFPAGYATTKYASGIGSHLYAFINTSGKTVNAVNCFSELTGGEGQHPSTYHYYKAEYDAVANPATDKAGIIAGLKDNTAYRTTEGINNGYPHLWYETLPAMPDYLIKNIKVAPLTQEYTGSKGSYSGKLVGEREVTVKIEKNTAETPTVYIASYDMDGRLIKAAAADVNVADFSYSADIDCEKANYIKVFLWDEEQSPILNAYKSAPGKASTMNEVWPYIAGAAERKVNLVTIGDSLTDSVWTGSSYSWPKSGWEKYIMDYVDADEVAHVKHGHGGWTMQDFILGKTSYHYCDWQTIKTEFASNDYVIIALGTNDEGRIEGFNSGKTDAKYYSADQFKAWYEEIAADVKAKGANLIVLTPPPSHREIADGKFYGTNAWATTKALLQLAQEDPSVTVIDIGEAFANKLNELIDAGEYAVEDLIIQKDASGNVTGPGAVYVDSVHFSEYGADLLASVIAEEIAARGIGLEKYITLK